jgi:mRNA interferase MazF
MPKQVSLYQRKETISAVRRGELYLVAFDPTVGHEIQKTRPALIIQNDIGNQHSPLTIVAAVTSKVSPMPFPVEVVVERAESNGLKIRSAIRLDQIRTIDRQRLIQRLGSVDPTIMRRVDEAIQISLGLVEL